MNICFRYHLRSDNQKINALISCLDGLNFLDVQALLDREHILDGVKNSLKLFKSLDQRLQELISVPSLGDVKPSEFLSRARDAISSADTSDAVLDRCN